jgi:hypothetical protein
MSLDLRTLRPYVPLMVLVGTVAVGWIAFVRPVTAEHARAESQLTGLRQREMALRRELSDPSPRAHALDPAAGFQHRVAEGNASPAVLEQLARLASTAQARNLLIETVEGAAASASSPAGPAAASAASASAPGEAGRYTPQRDPRFALFDVPVSHAPIRVAFDADYAGIGRFLWSFRDLPTVVEIRALTLALVPADPGDEHPAPRSDALRVSMTLNAYSRPRTAVIQTSHMVSR